MNSPLVPKLKSSRTQAILYGISLVGAVLVSAVPDGKLRYFIAAVSVSSCIGVAFGYHWQKQEWQEEKDRLAAEKSALGNRYLEILEHLTSDVVRQFCSKSTMLSDPDRDLDFGVRVVQKGESRVILRSSASFSVTDYAPFSNLVANCRPLSIDTNSQVRIYGASVPIPRNNFWLEVLFKLPTSLSKADGKSLGFSLANSLSSSDGLIHVVVLALSDQVDRDS